VKFRLFAIFGFFAFLHLSITQNRPQNKRRDNYPPIALVKDLFRHKSRHDHEENDKEKRTDCEQNYPPKCEKSASHANCDVGVRGFFWNLNLAPILARFADFARRNLAILAAWNLNFVQDFERNSARSARNFENLD